MNLEQSKKKMVDICDHLRDLEVHKEVELDKMSLDLLLDLGKDLLLTQPSNFVSETMTRRYGDKATTTKFVLEVRFKSMSDTMETIKEQSALIEELATNIRENFEAYHKCLTDVFDEDSDGVYESDMSLHLVPSIIAFVEEQVAKCN